MNHIALLIFVIAVLAYVGWNWDPSRPHDPNDKDNYFL